MSEYHNHNRRTRDNAPARILTSIIKSLTRLRPDLVSSADPADFRQVVERARWIARAKGWLVDPVATRQDKTAPTHKLAHKPPPRPRGYRHNIKSARERMAQKQAQKSKRRPPSPPSPPSPSRRKPEGAQGIAHGPQGRWFFIDKNAPEAALWQTFLLSLFMEAPQLHSLRVQRAPLPEDEGGRLSVTASEGGLHAEITIGDDVVSFSQEADRFLRHELMHLCHALAAGDEWYAIAEDCDAAEAWAERGERELRNAVSPSVYLEMIAGETE